MFFYYRPQTNEVVMRSEGKLGTDLPYFEQEPTADEMNKIEQNHWLSHDKGKLKITTPDHVQKKQNVEDLKRQIDNAKDIHDMKKIIQSLLTV